jgi:hypothetical protein
VTERKRSYPTRPTPTPTLKYLETGIGVCFFYSFLNGWFWLQSLLAIALCLFLVVILVNIKNAKTSKDYASISKKIKLLMLAGILSMVLFI